jgi:dienelactone hydrolase
MEVQTRLVEYSDGHINYQGLIAVDAMQSEVRPGILVAPTIRGRSAFEEGKAQELARLGYAALAIDVYGKAELNSADDNTRTHMNALLADRGELQRRMALSLRALREQPEVDASRTAAIGFCFGGLCVLDLARAGAKLEGVVSFHGLLTGPQHSPTRAILARVLVLHGWDDPLVTPEQVLALSGELTAGGADWQLHAYGNTMHAFTNPAANDTTRGTVYDAAADRRSWVAMRNFLDELFNG